MENTKEKKNIFTKENILKGLKWFFFSYIWLAVLMFIIDIVTKTLVKNNMVPDGTLDDAIAIIPNFLYIRYIRNRGVAFGAQFNDATTNAIVFIGISVLGTIIITFALIKYWKKLKQLAKASLMLMLSGTVGNLIDRAFYIDSEGFHYVVDMIHLNVNGKAIFATFNVADSCLVVGTIMLIIYFIIDEVKEAKKHKLQEEQEFEMKKEQTESSETSEIDTKNDEEVKTIETKENSKTPKVEEKDDSGNN